MVVRGGGGKLKTCWVQKTVQKMDTIAAGIQSIDSIKLLSIQMRIVFQLQKIFTLIKNFVTVPLERIY